MISRFLFLICVLFFTTYAVAQQFRSVGIGTSNPDTSAVMELYSSDQGFLSPRLSTAQRQAIQNPAAGLLVYDTDYTSFWYFDGIQWTNVGSKEVWLKQGNAGTSPASHFLGTIDNTDLIIKTNNTEVARFTSSGKMGLSSSSPTLSLQQGGTDALGVAAGTSAQRPTASPTGAMRWNTDLSFIEVYTGTAWINLNTPPIGATYIQWSNAADPQNIYPNTTWVASDIANGSFIRARGGGANVATNATLTGVIQGDALQDHNHSSTVTVNSGGSQNTQAGGNHQHNWGGWWSNDDSKDYNTTFGNGDGNGNTISDGAFWWGGNPATTGSPSSEYNTINTSLTGSHNHGGATGNLSWQDGKIYPYDDNYSSNRLQGGLFDGDGVTCGNTWDGRPTTGNFMCTLGQHQHSISTDGDHEHAVNFYAHRHYIKERSTSLSGNHQHVINDHTHTAAVNVAAATNASIAAETRPDNVAVVFWRRVN